MGRINWREQLEWTEEQIEDLRFAGFAYIRQGKYDIALPFFEALSILNPENAYDAQTLGALYLQIGEAEKAYKTLEKALMLDSDHAATLLNLAKALFMLDRKQEGLKLAKMLTREKEKQIANIARALILAYGE